MDIWSLFWILLCLTVLPFHYKYSILILSLSAIFNASVILKFGGSALPLYAGVELIVILKLFSSYKGSGIIKFNDLYSGLIFFLIAILWLYTYLIANFFEGLRVYSGQVSFEDNYRASGVPLIWGSSNINQLVLLTIHLILLLLLYKRKKFISKNFYLKSILLSLIVFSLISFLWKFSPNLYFIFAEIFFNNNIKDIPPAINEGRLSGTFSEPSYAGVYIATFSLIMLVNKNVKYRLLGLILLSLGTLNLSASLLFTFCVSLIVIFIFSNNRIDLKVLGTIFLVTITILVFFIFNDYIFQYVSDKSDSVSGVVRSASNWNAVSNFITSFGFGVGVGSERPSSLIVSIINNLGIFFTVFLIYVISKFINISNDKYSNFLLMSLLIAFFGCFTSIPEFTWPIIWNLIFANVCSASVGVNYSNKFIGKQQ